MTNEEIKKESETLRNCPFCGGKAGFRLTKNDKAPLHIFHYPKAGVNCPARFDQYCDSFEQGRKWWNTRWFHPAGYGDCSPNK